MTETQIERIKEIKLNQQELLDNLRAVKGENHAKLVDQCLCTIAAHELVVLTMRSGNVPPLEYVMSTTLLSQTLNDLYSTVAKLMGFTKEQCEEATEDAARIYDITNNLVNNLAFGEHRG